jgi:hypothetical protein
MRSFVSLATALVAFLGTPTAGAQSVQTASATHCANGISWPTFSCNINCPGVPTPANGSVCIPKFSGPGRLIGISAQLSGTVGGSYSASVVCGFTAVTAQATMAATATLPCGGAVSLPDVTSITTGNAGGGCFVGFGLNPASGAGPTVSLPSTCLATFVGSGCVTVPITAAVTQFAYPSPGSATGSFALGGSLTCVTLTLTYTFVPPFQSVGGGTVGVAGVPALVGTGAPTTAGNVTLALSGGAPSAAALLGFTYPAAPAWSTPTALFGGIVHVLPNAGVLQISTDATGAWSLTVPWPPYAAGVEQIFQVLVTDAIHPSGVAMSDGLKVATY